MDETKVFTQFGIFYTDHEPTGKALGMERFNIHWKHLPSSKDGDRFVYCHNSRDFYKLISVWNVIGRGDWFYRAAKVY